MAPWQIVIVLLYAGINIYVFFKAFNEVKHKENVFGLTTRWAWLGNFVCGDAIIISPFWLLTCIIVLLLQDWHLFLLTIALFWVVRSAGEVIYWLNEQFADKNRNPPQTLRFYSLFHSDAIWFIYQLFWQCILVIALIVSLYIGALWIQSRF